MLEFSAWVKRSELAAKPWLIVGQGPTFAAQRQCELSKYNVWGLDHVTRELRVDVAHALDVETVVACSDPLEANCRWLLMPRRPLVHHKPGPPLESYFDRTPILRRLAMQNRLVSYLPAPTPQGRESPALHGHHGTLAAALSLLAQLGARDVRSLGLDGGHAFAPHFGELEMRGLQSIGYEHRDVPLREVDELFQAYGLDHNPLTEPMRVFVGVTESLRVPARVLEFTLRQRASQPVVVDYLLGVKPPRSHKVRHLLRGTSPLRRFAIPECCGYRGRALYLEPTAQVCGDLHALWEIPFGPQKILCTYQATRRQFGHEVTGHVALSLRERKAEAKSDLRDPSIRAGRQSNLMLLDCARLHWDLPQIVRGLDEGRYDHRQLLDDLCVVAPDEIAATLPPEWNCWEWFEPGRAKLVHYASAATHPWKNDDNPLAEVWHEAYREAVAAGAVPVHEVILGVAAGHLKRELLGAFEGPDAERVAAQRLDLPQRVRLIASHRAKQAVRGARRMAGDAVRRLRASGEAR